MISLGKSAKTYPGHCIYYIIYDICILHEYDTILNKIWAEDYAGLGGGVRDSNIMGGGGARIREVSFFKTRIQF